MNRPVKQLLSVQSSIWMEAVLVSVILCNLARADQVKSADAGPTPAVIEGLREMTPEQADRQQAVVVRGIITFADTAADLGLFIQDETAAGIYIKLEHEIDARAGQEIQIEGVTGAGDFVPLVQARNWHVLGEKLLPSPRRVS